MSLKDRELRLRSHRRIRPLDLRPFQTEPPYWRKRRQRAVLRWTLVLGLMGLLGLTLGVTLALTTGSFRAW